MARIPSAPSSSGSTSAAETAAAPLQRAWFRRPSRIIPLAAALTVLCLVAAFLISPWPAALVIRAVFEQSAAKTLAEMTTHDPGDSVTQTLDVPYGGAGADTGVKSDTSLDVFTPSSGTGALVTVVWIHGGAWISGDKKEVRPYVRLIAAGGFTTVALNYSVSPEQTYPTALTQLNAALGFLIEHAAEFRVDPSRIVLAGDSAGANLASQLAVLTTSGTYADQLGLQPALRPDQLRAVILNCGIYDVSGIPDAPGIGGWGFRSALWSYLGERDWLHTPGGQQMSTLDDVTADFPATWISGGDADPLTPGQSEPLAARLTQLGVAVTPLFYGAEHEPKLPHEYQFHLDGADARAALDSTMAFLRSVTA